MSRKGENIYKRKDKRWEGRYIKGYRPDGTAKLGYCYGKSYREAKLKLAEAKALAAAGMADETAIKKKRLIYFCDEWLRLNRDRVKESTFVKYSGMVEKHIKPGLGGCMLQALTSSAVEEFSHELLFEKELSAKTVKDILTILNSIIKYVSKQHPGQMPNVDIVYPKVPKNEIRVLTKEEQSRFIRYLLEDMDEYKFGALLSLLTGMRIGEVCALRWSSVSIEERLIQVSSTMQRLKDLEEGSSAKTKIVISDPKSDFSARVIPITAYTAELCRTKYNGSPAAYVLTGEKDRFVEPRNMQYRLERYTRECGLEGVHFHTLRHTFATRCVEVDFEIKSLSEILGHSSPRITLERYVHSSLELKRNNMNKLAAIGF